jgi:hypothetical protein
MIDGSMRFDPMNVASKSPLWNFEAKHPLRFGVPTPL